MTTSLEHDIRTALDRQADSTTIDPDAQFNVRPLRLDANAPEHRRRFAVPAMVAAAAIALVGGLVVTTQLRDADPVGVADEPTAPAELDAPAPGPSAFPVLDDVPNGLSVTALTQATPEQPPWNEALIGRQIDGVLTDAIAIVVQANPFDISTPEAQSPTTAIVLGEPATVYPDGPSSGASLVHVTWGTGPYFLATGTAPLSFLDRATSDNLRATPAATTDQPPALEIGQLPDDFDVIVAPQAVGHPTQTATLSVGSDNYDISVSTRNPVVAMALAGPLRRIQIGGDPAWMFLSSFPTQDIAWQVNDSTYAYLKINDGTDAAAALELAESLAFVDAETWTTRYSPTTTAAASE